MGHCTVALLVGFVGGWRRGAHKYFQRQKRAQPRSKMVVAPALPPDFKEVFSIEHEDVPIQLVKHQPSGMHLCLAKVNSPLVQGYFAVHTEAEDHYGCPHTLEHLVFMGSKQYPYKGVLDLLANQCLSQGTNAWTDTDNTTYTVETAGAEGFLNIFPIFMDHLLYPTLEESAFLTEIHHIDGEGADAGVVYCEMQARENEMEDIVDFTKRQLLFSDQNKSLKAETGGRLLELRDISNERIRAFHRSCYAPCNICVIVCGMASMNEICEGIKPVLERYPGEMPVRHRRPFSTPIEVLQSSSYKEISFPAEDDDAGGCFELAWFGPAWEKFDERAAMGMLFSYLSRDSISPLRKAFCDVTGKEPLCASVGFGKTELSRLAFSLTLRSIDVAQLKGYTGEKRLDEVVLEVVKNAAKDLGMERIKSLLEHAKRSHLSNVESHPLETYFDSLHAEFLFGPSFKDGEPERTGETLLENMRKMERYERLLSWSKEKWASLLEDCFLSRPYVALLALPSKDAAAKLQEEEEGRLQKQKENLGEEGMKAHADKLEAAEAANGKEVPEEMKKMGLPDLRKVSLIACETLDTCTSAEGGKGPVCDAARVQFSSAKGAQFCDVRFVLQLDLEGLAKEKLLKVLPIWTALAFESPLKKSEKGAALSAEETVKKCTDVLNSKGVWTDKGCLVFHCRVIKSQLEEGARLLMRIKEDIDFTEEKVKIAAARLLNQIPAQKRCGSSLKSLGGQPLLYDDAALTKVFSWPVLLKEFKALGEEGEGASNKLKEIVAQLAELRDKHLSVLAVHVSGELGEAQQALFTSSLFEKCSQTYKPLGSWSQLRSSTQDLISPLLMDKTRPGCRGVLVPAASIETTYLTLTLSARHLESSLSFSHPDFAALLLAMECFDMLEGPFWCKIRGKGLAYGFSTTLSPESGLMRFSVSESSNPVLAFQEARKIVEEAVRAAKEGSGLLRDETVLNGARSGIAFGAISRVSTVTRVLEGSYNNTMGERRPEGHVALLLARLMELGSEEVSRAAEKYLLPLFTGQGLSGEVPRVFSVSAAERKGAEVKAAVQGLGWSCLELTVQELEEGYAQADGYAAVQAKLAA